MEFAGLNYIAIVVAALAGFAFGAVYYMALGKAWMAALGRTKEELRASSARPMATPFIISIVALLVMAWVLAGLMGHLGPGAVTLKNGIISGGFVWLGFVITTLGVNHGFQGSKVALTAIDGLHWLGVLVIMGAVIGAFGV